MPPASTLEDMFVKQVGTAHQASGTCQKATSRRERQKVATQHAEMKANVDFTVNGKPIKIVEEFEYLGRLVTKDDKDGPAVMKNLARARAKWASMRRFLVRDAADPKTMAAFDRTVVLYVLLYESESWVLTGDLMRQPRNFHRRCCRGLTGKFIQQDEEGEWIWDTPQNFGFWSFSVWGRKIVRIIIAIPSKKIPFFKHKTISLFMISREWS
jgi:hypothetical protein